MPLNRMAVIALAALIYASHGLSGFAQNAPPPGPYEARLDALAAARDTVALSRAIFSDKADVEIGARAAAWLKDRQLSKGDGTLIAVLYSALLWQAAQQAPEPGKTRLSREATGQYLLARLLVSTEGLQCRDTTALGGGLASVERRLGMVRDHMPVLPEADRKALLADAFKTLLATFPMRENDVWLCSLGTDQMRKYLEKHPVPGEPGTTVTIENDPSILPEFVPYADWQARRRARLDATADIVGAGKLSDYGDASHRLK
ncbi:hypothetical protein BH10PSE6_BH10PSE6_57350 [soil metagenome]